MTDRKKSQKQESAVAKQIGGRTVVASGALWGSKGDARSVEYLVECKTTSKPYYSLTLKTWYKISMEALHDRMRTPLMCVYLNDGKDQMAVFVNSDFKDFENHKKFCESLEYDCDIIRDSFRVTNKPCKKVFSRSNDIMSIIRWEDFLEIIDGGTK